MVAFLPSDANEVAELVRHAAASGIRLTVQGHGTKADIGAASENGAICDVTGIAGVVDYDPAELVLTVRPGTPLAEVEALLAANGQMLAFEPWDLTRSSGPGATIGGMVAAGLAGPRRVTRGSVRDHLLGFAAVSGRGERFVAGGKVVKNVTGYDLSKLMCGSWGRLAVLTELTLKVLPAPPLMRTLAIFGLEAATARLAMAKALGSRADVAAAAYLPGSGECPSRVLLRLEGIAPSIAARIDILAQALSDVELADMEDGNGEWGAVAGLSSLAGASQLWRIVLPARAMPELGQMLDAHGAAWLADWAGGLVWTGWTGEPAPIRAYAESAGGHAMLVRADGETRARIPTFHPQSAGIVRLEARVRRAFDPAGVFETGRFGDGHAD